MKSYSNLENHIVILGYNPNNFHRILRLIERDKKHKKRSIVLGVVGEMEKPHSDGMDFHFVCLRSYTSERQLERLGIRKASSVILDAADDVQNMTAALRVAIMIKKDCHAFAYFKDPSMDELIADYCDNIETTSSRRADIIVRATQDPGTVRATEMLLSGDVGATMYTMQVEKVGSDGVAFGRLSRFLRTECGLILFGYATDIHGRELLLNPSDNAVVHEGMSILYIGNNRMKSDEINWYNLVKVPMECQPAPAAPLK